MGRRRTSSHTGSSAAPEGSALTRSIACRTAIASLLVATVALPSIVGAQSAAPSASGDPGAPPEAWAAAVCTADARIEQAQPAIVAVGQSALAGDADGVAVAAITAGLLGDEALRALEAVTEPWGPGTAYAGYLSATGFALVDVGVALAETDLFDPDALRTALGNTIAAYDGWSRAEAERMSLEAATGFDCAAVALPSPTPEPSQAPGTPGPTITGDAELEARFPAMIAGLPVAPESRTGQDLLATTDPEDIDGLLRLQELTDFLAANDRTIDDVSLAFAFVPTEDGIGASITAFRVAGGDAAALLEGLIPIITVDYLDPQRATVTVGGRELMRISDGQYDPTGIYEIIVPSGDTVWAVSAADPVLTEIVTAFPG